MRAYAHRLAAVLAAAILTGACGCRTSYEQAVAARRSVLYGDGAYALERAGQMAGNSTDANLGKFELGRLRQLAGDFEGSSGVFGPQLEDFFVDESEGPVLKLGNAGGNIMAATVGDDRYIPYDVPAYELICALQYESLNSLYLGRRDNARVYLRRATAAQEQIKENAEQEAAADGDSSGQEANIATASGTIRQYLDPVANSVRTSYENALVWYLMGVMFELEGGSGNDTIAYREAATISPDVARFVDLAPGGGEDVIVVFEESLVDFPEPVKIPLTFLGGTVWSVDFPSYKNGPYAPSRIGVSSGGAGCEFVRAVNVQALAYRSLRDRLAGIVTRNVTRAALKIAAQQAANHISTGNSFGDMALMLGVFVFNAIGTATDEADTRSWQTLPQCVQMCRIRLPKGRRDLRVVNHSTGKSLDLSLPSGGKGPWLVWISDVHAYSTVGVIPLASGAPSWGKNASILGVKY